MGQGKIAWIANKFSSLTFDESHYLTLGDDNAFDYATYDFAVELLLYWDSTITNPGTDKLLISKCPGSLGNSEAGWEIMLNPTSASLIVKFNDGNATMLSKTYTGTLASNTWHHIRLEFDRDSTVHFYLNGELEDDTFDISGRPNSVNNSDDIYVGHQSGGSNDYFKGYLGMVRLDGGPGWLADADGDAQYVGDRVTNYGDSWNLANYYRLKYGHPRIQGHYVAAWYFANSLVDESSEEYTFTWAGGGSASYADGWPTTVTYSFAYDPLAAGGVESGFIDLDFRLRSLDGTFKLYSTPGPDKQYRMMSFRTDDLEQCLALEGAYTCKAPLYLYDNGSTPYPLRGYLMAPPIRREVYASIYKTVWEIALQIEEI